MPKAQPEDILSEYLPNGLMRSIPLKDLVGEDQPFNSIAPAYKAARAGDLPVVKIGNQYRVVVALYNEMLRERVNDPWVKGHAGRYERKKKPANKAA